MTDQYFIERVILEQKPINTAEVRSELLRFSYASCFVTNSIVV